MYKNWNPGSTEHSICHIKNINRPCHGLGSQREGKTNAQMFCEFLARVHAQCLLTV